MYESLQTGLATNKTIKFHLNERESYFSENACNLTSSDKYIGNSSYVTHTLQKLHVSNDKHKFIHETV